MSTILPRSFTKGLGGLAAGECHKRRPAAPTSQLHDRPHVVVTSVDSLSGPDVLARPANSTTAAPACLHAPLVP